MKNVTITADEEVLKWARHEAVDKGISASKLVGQILEAEMRKKKRRLLGGLRAMEEDKAVPERPHRKNGPRNVV